jgi:hypothetical protein
LIHPTLSPLVGKILRLARKSITIGDVPASDKSSPLLTMVGLTLKYKKTRRN